MTAIDLTINQIQVLLLLCGHDCFHDFFQSKPASWHTLTGGGQSGGKSSKSKQKQLTVKKKKPKKGKQSKKKKKPKKGKSKKYKKGRAFKAYPNNKKKTTGIPIKKTFKKSKETTGIPIKKTIKKSKKTTDIILDELTEYFTQSLEYLQECRSDIDDHMTIYDYFEKNLTYQERVRIIGEEGGDIGSAEGWSPNPLEVASVNPILRPVRIPRPAPMDEDAPPQGPPPQEPPPQEPPPQEPPSQEPPQAKKQRILGGGRVRKPSELALKKMQEERTEKLALWSELEAWDKSVEDYLRESINQQVNNKLKEGLYIQSYKTYMKETQDIENAKDHFMALDLSGKGSSKDKFNSFKNKYKPFNLGGLLRKISENLPTDINEVTINSWKTTNGLKKVSLSKAQKEVLNQLNRKIMEFWCKFIYGDKPPLDGSWIESQYKAMNKGKYPNGKNQSDGELMRLFKGSIDPIKLEQDPKIAKGLLTITKQAYSQGNSINNAAALQNYYINDKTDKNKTDENKELFERKDQYNCVVPSVIDPQSVCPDFKFKNGMKSEDNILQVKGDHPFSITITYSVIKGKEGGLTCEIKNNKGVTLKAKNHCNDTLKDDIIIDKEMPRKHLQISEVIKQIVDYIKEKEKKINEAINDDDFIRDIVQICLGKLCGDFSQELYAITKILQGEPTVYVANDQPSAIRFLYLIGCLRYIIGEYKWWGGYLSAKNNVLLSSKQP